MTLPAEGPVTIATRGHCLRCGCPCRAAYCASCTEAGAAEQLPRVDELPGGSAWDFMPSGMNDSERRAARRKKGR